MDAALGLLQPLLLRSNVTNQNELSQNKYCTDGPFTVFKQRIEGLTAA